MNTYMMSLNFTIKHASLFDSKVDQQNIYGKLDEFLNICGIDKVSLEGRILCILSTCECMTTVAISVSNEISLLFTEGNMSSFSFPQTSGQICIW